MTKGAWGVVLLLYLAGVGCSVLASQPAHTEQVTKTTAPSTEPQGARRLPLQARWQIQYTEALSTALDVDVFNLDLFDTPAQVIRDLHQRGVLVIEYDLDPAAFCPQALGLNFNALHKTLALDAYRVDCREWAR